MNCSKEISIREFDYRISPHHSENIKYRCQHPVGHRGKCSWHSKLQRPPTLEERVTKLEKQLRIKYATR